MSFKEYTKALTKEGVEGDLLKTVFTSIITSLAILSVFYYLKLRFIEDFIPKYGFFIFLSILSYSLLLTPIRQIRAYKEFPCMSGMMIGMTIGMFAGFIPGFYIGATNGMFWGSLFGMIIGIYFGVSNGKCCGIMGVMEGIMAGFMGGLMGAMTAIMMFNDNLKASAIIIFIISALILLGLSFMIYGETKGAERRSKEGMSFTIIWSAILTISTILMIVSGPRSLLFQ